MRLFFGFLFLGLALATVREILHEWVSVDYDWEYMGEDRQAWLDAGLFTPPNCVVAGVKQWGSSLFLTIPRWREGVPGTLNLLTYNSRGVPVLRPFPDLASQNLSNPGAFWFIQSMEIDPEGVMWIIDAGMLNNLDPNPDHYRWGKPQLLLYDLSAHKWVGTWDLSSVTVKDTSFVNDIVVDHRNRVAYLSDSNGDGGLIVVDTKNNFTRRYSGKSTQAQPNDSGVYEICGINYELGPTPSDGIALSPDGTRVYYCPLVGRSLFSLDAAVFRDPKATTKAIEDTIVYHGEKLGMSDGLAMTSDGTLYYGDIDGCGINYWNISEGKLTPQNQRYLQNPDPENCNWADTFAFDSQGKLLVTTNHLEQFVTGVFDITGNTGPLYRVIAYDVDKLSYMV